MKKYYFPLNKATTWFGSGWTILKCYLLFKIWTEPRTRDTQWRHKSEKSETLGRCGRKNMLRTYLKIWNLDLILGRAVKAISSLGVRSPWSNQIFSNVGNHKGNEKILSNRKIYTTYHRFGDFSWYYELDIISDIVFRAKRVTISKSLISVIKPFFFTQKKRMK